MDTVQHAFDHTFPRAKRIIRGGEMEADSECGQHCVSAILTGRAFAHHTIMAVGSDEQVITTVIHTCEIYING